MSATAKILMRCAFYAISAIECAAAAVVYPLVALVYWAFEEDVPRFRDFALLLWLGPGSTWD